MENKIENTNLPEVPSVAMPTVVTPPTAVTAIASYLAAEDPQATIGKLIKFSKGEYLKGMDAEVVPTESLFSVACDMTLCGFIRWHDGKPAEHKIVRIASGDPVPRRDDLGYDDKDEWPVDAKGDSRDPWQPVIYIPMMSEAGELGTFTTGSRSGIKSVHRLLRRYATHAARHPDDYPLIRLKVAFFMHSDRAIGKVFYPEFEPAGYVDRAEFCEALEAIGIDVNRTEQKALPKPVDEMNDVIPF
jgi:hypothetical protein